MSAHGSKVQPVLTTCDPIWTQVRNEAEEIASRDPALASFIISNVLNHEHLDQAICHRVAQRLDHDDVGADMIRQTFDTVLDEEPSIKDAFRKDLAAIFDRDPACNRVIEPLLYFKGFHAVQTYRFANALWARGRRDFALYLQSQCSRVFGVDIHPMARIGSGLMIDHADSVVIGETATIDDDVSILHGVTLGGSGKEGGDRHPKIGRCVLIGAGAKILGNIRVGECARVASGSVVLHDVPAHTTVAGVPAKVVGLAGCNEPARRMDQRLGIDD